VSDEILARVEKLQAACDRHGVPLAAAALQFPMREPRITATLAGCVTPAEVDRLIENARWEIPGELWEEIAP
jgi:D-threo-aldose 1-dehydrogenase